MPGGHLLPHAGDEQKCWIGASFCSTAEGSEGCEFRKVASASLQHEEEAPHEDVRAEILADWEALKHEVGWKCPR